MWSGMIRPPQACASPARGDRIVGYVLSRFGIGAPGVEPVVS
jgi:hypothetical protein